MSLPKIFIVLNPHAAKGRAALQQRAIENYFSSKNVPITLEKTTKPFDAISLAKEAVIKGYKTIVAAGGDGTVNEVVDGVVNGIRQLNLSFEESPVIGQIPIGRGNDFAFFAKIPKNLEEACDLIISQKWKATDYGELFGGVFEKGRCFINGVGIGFEPMVNYVASSFKRVSGMVSYLLAFVKILLNYPEALSITIKTEKEEIFIESQQISICNGRRMGSTFIMGPEAEIDDGLLDIVYANKPIKGSHIIWYALRFFSGSQLKTERFSMIRAKEVTITTEKELLVCHTDGEGVSEGCSSVKVKLTPKGLKFLRKSQVNI